MRYLPQVYYAGLLAGTNDMELLSRTGAGRDINRHHYTRREIEANLSRPVASALIDLIRVRNSHPAFSGEFCMAPSGEETICIEWRKSKHWIRLEVNLTGMTFSVVSSAIAEAPQ